MTEPSQYFKGRTVQEQMNEVIGYVDVRSAEVATDAIAADVAQVHQDMLDADADATAAAASAAAAAGTLANAVKKTGESSQSIAGNIEVSGTVKSTGTLYASNDASVGGNLGVGGTASLTDVVVSGIATVPTPTGNNYAANKKYVDDQDALNVKLAGSQNITGNKTVPLEATGTFSNQIASSNKVKNELDAYTPMVRTTGAQNIAGEKTLTNKLTIVTNAANPVVIKSPSASVTSSGSSNTFVMKDQNDITIFAFNYSTFADGHATVWINVRNADGTLKQVILASGNQ